MVDAKDVVGFMGATFLTITLIPQVFLSYKQKNVDNISKGFLSIQLLTCFTFLAYGILLEELPLILANTIVLSQTFILVWFKIIYKSTIQSTNDSSNNIKIELTEI